MLECSSLLLLPWATENPRQTGQGEAEARRTILDASSLVRAGFVCRAPFTAGGWLRRLLPAAPAWEVHEAEDDSLLFTVGRSSFSSKHWNVLDADNKPVGKVRSRLSSEAPLPPLRASFGTETDSGAVLHANDRQGRLLIFRTDGGMPNSQDEPLGTLSEATEGTRLTFAGDEDGDPFTRMLLLAAALILTDRQK